MSRDNDSDKALPYIIITIVALLALTGWVFR